MSLHLLLLLYIISLSTHEILLCECTTSANLQPLNYVALLNQENKPTFSCTVHGANYASWEINDQSDLVDRESERQRRGIETEHDEIQGMSRSYHATLKLSPSLVNRYTKIQCWASVRDGSGPSVVSATAIFQIQGLLGEPRNITSSPLNKTHTLIQWQPPHTLNITDIEPDIQQYTVCVSHTGISQYCFNNTSLELVLPNLNVRKEVNVSAWNGLGRGEIANLSINACEPQDISGVEVVVETTGEFDEIILSLTFNFSEGTQTSCYCLYNLTLSHTSRNNNTIMITTIGPLTPSVFESDGFTISLSEGILPNKHYEAELICVTHYEPGGVFPNTTLLFSSFDVQDVTLEINEENSSLLICCTFAVGSRAQGCLILIATTTNSTQQQQHFMRNLSRHDSIPSTCWEETNIDRGVVYTMAVYDLEQDGSFDLTNPVFSNGSVFINKSGEDYHNEKWSSTIAVSTTTPKFNKDDVQTTSVSQISIDKTSVPSLYIIIAGSSAAGVLLVMIAVLLSVLCWVQIHKKTKRKTCMRDIVNPNFSPLDDLSNGFSFKTTMDLKVESDLQTHNVMLTDKLQPHSTNQTHFKSPTITDSSTHTVVQCPLYDHSAHSDQQPGPVYEKIAPQWSHSPPTATTGSRATTVPNESYCNITTFDAAAIAMEENVAYGTSTFGKRQRRATDVARGGHTSGRRFTNRGPLPRLPLDTSSTSHAGSTSHAAVYETVNDLHY